MDISQVAEIGLEGAGVLLLCVLSYKIYKMKCSSDSKCFKAEGENGIEVHTENEGVSNV